jgi:hypothetical protein
MTTLYINKMLTQLDFSKVSRLDTPLRPTWTVYQGFQSVCNVSS